MITIKSLADLGQLTTAQEFETNRTRSISRARRAEDGLTEAGLFPLTKQFQAFADTYLVRLEDLIYQEQLNCHGNRDKDVWVALAQYDNREIARRLLIAAGVGGSKLTYFGGESGWYLPLGHAMGFKGKTALKVGEWAYWLLCRLPFRSSMTGGNLEIDRTHIDPAWWYVPDADWRDYRVDEMFECAIQLAGVYRPDLRPLTEPPIPWTQIDAGVLPPDNEIQIKLVDAHWSVENAWREAIAAGQMADVLAAINYLQATPFIINNPILRLLQRQKPPETPSQKPKSWQEHKLGEYYKTRHEAWEWRYMLKEAELLGHAPFYVPLKFDTRGRIDGVCHFAFQRGDFVRSLFLFGVGEPISEDGLLWLAAHAAARADGIIWDGTNYKPSAYNGRPGLTNT